MSADTADKRNGVISQGMDWLQWGLNELQDQERAKAVFDYFKSFNIAAQANLFLTLANEFVGATYQARELGVDEMDISLDQELSIQGCNEDEIEAIKLAMAEFALAR